MYDHNPFNYLNFIIHLRSINSDELNGTESYILEMFEDDNINWFPMNSSLSLNNQRRKRKEKKQNEILLLEAEGEDIKYSMADYLQERIPMGLKFIDDKCHDLFKSV